MLTISSVLACATVLLTTPAIAQTTVQPQAIPGPVRNAGIYHVPSGTWSRSSGAIAALGPDVIYRNDASSGYFSGLSNAASTGDWSRIDAARVPTSGGSVAGVTQSTYVLNGLQFAYCTDVVGPNLGITFNLFDSYKPCDLLITAPTGPVHLAGIIKASGLPGGASGNVACWIVTLDVSGGGEFCLEGDGGPVFPGDDADLEFDAFGLDWVFNGVAGTVTGPILAGDPSWTVAVSGAQLWGGGGTYYHPMSSCADTGLDVRDFMTLDGFNSGLGPGCYWFGGYKNTNGCGGPINIPLAAFYSILYAELGATLNCNDGAVFCQPAGTNSSGDSVVLIPGPSASAGSGMHLNAFGGPPGQAGYFLVSGGNAGSLAVGQGTLCLSGPIGRYSPVFGGAGNSLGDFNLAGIFRSTSGTSGQSAVGFDIPASLPAPIGGSIVSGSSWHFQLWYRDQNPGSTSNFSSGLTLQF